MDRMLYVGMSGAKQSMLALGVNNNNVANASTTGFKSDKESFKTVEVEGAGHKSRAYAISGSDGIDFSHGTPISTGNGLDVAIKGEGWIAIQAPDGTEAYTRAGDLEVSPLGLLRTSTGHPVIGNAGPIAIPPYEKLEFGADGTISIVPLGQSAAAMAVVDRIKLVNPPNVDLEKGDDGLVRSRNGGGYNPDARVTIQQGFLESSNVNVVEGMTKMITLSRNFELQVKVMKTAEEIDASSARLLQRGA